MEFETGQTTHLKDSDRKALLEERIEVREAINAFGPLITSGGWRKLVPIVEKMIRQREVAALYGDETSEARRELAGEAAGMKILLSLPGLFLDQRDILDKREDEE